MKGERTHIILWKLIFLSIFIFHFSFLPAVETIIVGEIVNETNGEPIPNVNIHFRGTKIGTTSDEYGNYALRVDMTDKAQLVFSAVGYFTQRFEIEPGAMAGLQVAMREKTATLTEIVVAPNENPALELLRQVREHRPDNDRTLHSGQAFVARREQTLFVSHIQKKHIRRALWRSLQSGMIAQEDSTYILPLYRETQSFKIAGNDMIPANDQQTQALILTSTDYSSLLGNEGNLNFYANSVSLMGHAFLSPLATSGNSTAPCDPSMAATSSQVPLRQRRKVACAMFSKSHCVLETLTGWFQSISMKCGPRASIGSHHVARFPSWAAV